MMFQDPRSQKSYHDVFTRLSKEIILKPNPDIPFMSHRIFNPAVAQINQKIHLFFRSIGATNMSLENPKGSAYEEIVGWKSVIGQAVSLNGIDFTYSPTPAISGDGWSVRGVEDPRITHLPDEKRWLMSYAAFNGESVHLKIAESFNGIDWVTKTPEAASALVGDWGFKKFGGVAALPDFNNKIVIVDGISPKDDRWDKSAAIFPKVGKDGKYHMLFGEFSIWHAVSNDGYNWEVLPDKFLEKRTGDYFDNTFIEAGPPPIYLGNGQYLVLYHGIDTNYVYRLGGLIVDEGFRILSRSKNPLFGPRTPTEILGWYYKQIYNEFPQQSGLSIEELFEMAAAKRREVGTFNPIVVFCCGTSINIENSQETLCIYYGAGDSVVCGAKAAISDIVDAISKSS